MEVIAILLAGAAAAYALARLLNMPALPLLAWPASMCSRVCTWRWR
jgi:hypothetical protein